MRKSGGFTAGRIGGAGTLRFVLGGDSEPFAGLRERFVSAINSLHDADRDVLMAAFGLSPETEGLTTLRQRRQYYGQTIGRGVDTVAARETAALVNLRNQLLTGWYPASPLNVRVPELHNGIVQEAVHIVTIVNDMRWQETREYYRFFAAFDEADYLTISSDFSGVAIPLPQGGSGRSAFTVRTRRVRDSFSHDFYHVDADGKRAPMRRGNSYDLRFKLVPDPDYDDPGLLTETSRAFHERTLTATFEVVFIGQKPERIWAFERLSVYERPGIPPSADASADASDGGRDGRSGGEQGEATGSDDSAVTPVSTQRQPATPGTAGVPTGTRPVASNLPSPTCTLLDLGEGSSVQVGFRDLYGGLFNGVAWEW